MSDFYSRMLDLGPVEEHAGGSGYFNKPDETLDPRLFDGTVLHPEVREWILKTFYDYFGKQFKDPESWSTVWLAGSGISYQWSGDRSNGDLDVLIGVDFPNFYDHNLDFVGITENELADMWNTDFKANLWPKTATTSIGGGTFEVTFYINPGSTDIRDIHPYAAYDVSHNTWTVKPPVLPENPETLYPKEWWDQVRGEKKHADSIVSRYNGLWNQLKASSHSPDPAYQNLYAQMVLTVDQGRALFDDIHLNRKKAFGRDGQGYGDYYNFRWQAHKRFGTMQALNSMARSRQEDEHARDTTLYGKPIENATQALTKAALWNTPYRRP